MQPCLICGMNNYRCIHVGTRDVPNLKVLKCISCGCVQLESRVYNAEENYVLGDMLRGGGITLLRMTDRSWIGIHG